MKRFVVLLIFALVLAASPFPSQSVYAGIEYFTASPPSPVNVGTWVTLHGKGDSGTSRFLINGEPRAELGVPEHTETWKTEEFGPGNYKVCYQLRQNGGWDTAETRCIDYVVKPVKSDAPPQTSGGADFTGYCKAIGYDRFGGNQYNAYTGICAVGDKEQPIDMYTLCAWQYGGRLPYPGLADTSNIFSWTCNSNPAYIAPPFSEKSDNSGGGNSGDADNPGKTPIRYGAYPEAKESQGGVHVAVICNILGKGSPTSEPSDGDAYGWRCGDGSVFDFDQACKMAYGANFAAILDWNKKPLKYGWRCTVGGANPTAVPRNGSNVKSSGVSGDCSQALSENLQVGQRARVTYTDGSPNRLRGEPSRSGSVITTIPEGGEFDILDGPVCQDGWRWWKVSTSQGTGWMADSGDGTRYIEPWDNDSGNSSSPNAKFPDARETANGGIHVSIICQHWGYQGARFHDGNETPFSWECYSGSDTLVLDFSRACRDAYGDERPYGVLLSAADKNSWRCSPRQKWIENPLTVSPSCTENRDGTFTCAPIGINDSTNNPDDPFVAVFELPEGLKTPSEGDSEVQKAQNQIERTYFQGRLGTYLDGEFTCGEIDRFTDSTTGVVYHHPGVGFKYVQGCVHRIEMADTDRARDARNWSLIYKTR